MGGMTAGLEVEQRGLAGAVGTDETEALARLDGEAHAVQRGETTEALEEPGDLEERLGHLISDPAGGAPGPRCPRAPARRTPRAPPPRCRGSTRRRCPRWRPAGPSPAGR